MSKFLEEVYKLDPATDSTDFYDRYADDYDSAVSGGGYVTPERIATALDDCVEDKATQIFDFGCGTGLLGESLARRGFTRMDGGDVSAEMLERAREKGVYRDLLTLSPGAALPFSSGVYPIITAAGVISPAHAPADTIDLLLTALPEGGLLAFSLNDQALAQGFEGRVNEHVDAAAAECLFREHGAHMPAEDLMASVYILKKR